jgi:hypothetical protein
VTREPIDTPGGKPPTWLILAPPRGNYAARIRPHGHGQKWSFAQAVRPCPGARFGGDIWMLRRPTRKKKGERP